MSSTPGCQRRPGRAAQVLGAAALLGALLVQGCAAPRGLVSEPERPRLPGVTWQDDGPLDTLGAAIGESLQYFRRLPPTTRVTYGPFSYTPQQLARSLEVFWELTRAELANPGPDGAAPDPQRFQRRLLERFHVFESVAPTGRNLFTGYYAPFIPGSETPTAHLDTPLYARPLDLVEVPLQEFSADLPARTLVGRMEGGRLVPYYTRAQIAGDALKGVAKPIVYVDLVDLFVLQIQGSGEVWLPDGRVVAVGYDVGNGQPYRSLGAELVRRNLLKRDEISMQSIRRFLAIHPESVRELLNTNPSYVFFRPLPGQSQPLGSAQVPLTPGRSLAADRALVPLGGLVYVITQVPVLEDSSATRPFQRFMLVQDTGGAIKGHGRGDIYWGAGNDAEWLAGHSQASGRLFLLVARQEALAESTADVSPAPLPGPDSAPPARVPPTAVPSAVAPPTEPRTP